jgi:hypothetical protein
MIINKEQWHSVQGEIIMKCQFCNVEMVYKPNMRGILDYSYLEVPDFNTLIVDYTKELEEDCLIFKIKRKKADRLIIKPMYYVCPKCGQIITKIPDEMIDDVIEAEK